MTRQDFIEEVWAAAEAVQRRGARISVPIVVAQAALESGWGASALATDCKNLFGIKGPGRKYFTKEQDAKGNEYTIETSFRCYDTWTESISDYADIVARLSWYQDAEDAAHDPAGYLKGIIAKRDEFGKVKEPGWATDINYYNKVWRIVEDYKLLERSEYSQDITLIQIYDGELRYDFEPLKVTFGVKSDGTPKLMARIKSRGFFSRFRSFLFGD